MPKVNAVLDHMKEFTAKVVDKEWKVIGINFNITKDNKTNYKRSSLVNIAK